MNNGNERTFKIFNSQNYYMEVRLHNPDGDELYMNPAAIFQLVIEDNLIPWKAKGFLVYDNPYEVMERKMVSDQYLDNAELDAETRANLKGMKPYCFRNDGRDYLDIIIKPQIDKDAAIGDLSVFDNLTDAWEINLKCVIYDKEDIEVPNITKKAKKFFFWDVDYQTMIENKVEWSTATSTENPTLKSKGSAYKPSLATDDERKMFTGDIIKSMLKDNNLLVGDDFDAGSTKMFYTCYNDKNLWENINYILDQHLSEKIQNKEALDEHDICIFGKDRYTDKFELKPLYKYFEKAGNDPYIPKEYQLEHLYFDEVGDVIPSPNKAPLLEEMSSTNDVKLGKIKMYQFVDLSSSDSTKCIATKPVISYDFKNKTFSINVEDSNVIALKDKLKKLYIDNKVLVNKQGEPLITLNQNKTSNNNINPIYSVRNDKEFILKTGLGSLLYTSMFLNGCLYFQIDGATIRRSGRFVGIDRETYSDNNLDYKLCGQWFVTSVTHNFFHNMYINQITAVKSYSYNTLKRNETVA